LAVVVGGISLCATGQSGRGGGYRPASTNRVAAHLRWLGEQLNLTNEQKAKLKPMLMKEGQKIRSVRQDSSIPKDQKMEKVEAIHESFSPQINDVLTPEQREKYKQLEKEALERRQQANSGGSTPSPAQQSNHKSDD
jgi:Spy/CpxP family protein refolding chaperone